MATLEDLISLSALYVCLLNKILTNLISDLLQVSVNIQYVVVIEHRAS